MNSFFGEYAKQILNNGYEPIPIEPGTKMPKIKEWVSIKIDEVRISQWINTHPNHSIGIRTKNTPAIDIDITDEAANNEVQKLIIFCC